MLVGALLPQLAAKNISLSDPFRRVGPSMVSLVALKLLAHDAAAAKCRPMICDKMLVGALLPQLAAKPGGFWKLLRYLQLNQLLLPTLAKPLAQILPLMARLGMGIGSKLK
jgi:hypothetical protein